MYTSICLVVCDHKALVSVRHQHGHTDGAGCRWVEVSAKCDEHTAAVANNGVTFGSGYAGFYVSHGDDTYTTFSNMLH